ncbi:uncharacterized protein LOC121917773 [Sceloporus undulatus]|uniref:uncharacterized protein LOC121917773 n=1 Tax=Sceloporus undulatus TaxID=8520 RepID=UPI001C4B8315|nr:uncharacterized protein LOC121917773 [Sceloporus undulatus]
MPRSKPKKTPAPAARKSHNRPSKKARHSDAVEARLDQLYTRLAAIEAERAAVPAGGQVESVAPPVPLEPPVGQLVNAGDQPSLADIYRVLAPQGQTGVVPAQLTLADIYRLAQGLSAGRGPSRAEADSGQGPSTSHVAPSPDVAVTSEAGAAQMSMVNIGASTSTAAPVRQVSGSGPVRFSESLESAGAPMESWRIEVNRAILMSLAPSTQLAYHRSWRVFQRFVASMGLH